MKLPAELTDDELTVLASRAAALPDAPRAAVAAAIALWQQRPVSPLRRILALLTFDSAATPHLALGVRSAGPSAVRHLLFSAEGRDVDLRIHGEGSAFVLQGQILGPDDSGTIVLAGAGADRSAALDDLGAFRFDALPAGDYALALRTAQEQIDLPPIAVGRQVP